MGEIIELGSTTQDKNFDMVTIQNYQTPLFYVLFAEELAVKFRILLITLRNLPWCNRFSSDNNVIVMAIFKK